MPTNIGSQNLRVTTGLLNTVDDVYPGGGTILPGYAPGQIGMRVWLGKQEVKYDSHVGTLYEGCYQYVYTYAGMATPPALGLLAFWKDRNYYEVTTLDSHPRELAGVFISAITPGQFGFIQTFEGGRGTLAISGNCVAGDVLYALADGSATVAAANYAGSTAPEIAVECGQAMGADSGGLVLASLRGTVIV
jgi:hypothetical protein